MMKKKWEISNKMTNIYDILRREFNEQTKEQLINKLIEQIKTNNYLNEIISINIIGDKQ